MLIHPIYSFPAIVIYRTSVIPRSSFTGGGRRSKRGREVRGRKSAENISRFMRVLKKSITLRRR